MGCCQARSPKMEEDFYSIGLCFIEEGTRTFDNSPYDKIFLRYMQKNYPHEQPIDL